jgi:hypothetical protein
MHNRFLDPVFHQRAGDSVCYKTLSSNTGLLCLDWRNIGDGEQQCDNGWDEDNCDEHLCQDKMWSSGDGQCIIWSDKLVQNIFEPSFLCYKARHANYMCELHS